jgi:hypothetical protein
VPGAVLAAVITAVGRVSFPVRAPSTSFTMPKAEAIITNHGMSQVGALDPAQLKLPIASALHPRLTRTLERIPHNVKAVVKSVWNILLFILLLHGVCAEPLHTA